MRLGIYGGTFSPPHIGHVSAAKAFARQMQLDKLLIIPTYLPPHKEYGEEATAYERLSMCRLAFEDIPIAEISDLEIQRGGKSYTYETLEELAADGIDLYLLCGTDMILTFDLWRNFERIFSLATVCYIRRESNSESANEIEQKVEEYRKKYGAKIIEISEEAIEISSTKLRRRISTGKDVVEFLSVSVMDFIRERGLYK